MFGAWTFNALWHLLFGSFSVSTLIGIGAVAVAVLLPPALTALIPNLRLLAISVAIAAFSYSSVAGKFYNDGLSVKQAEWDAAIKQEAADGEDARTDAERTTSRATPERVRKDPRNRDNWK